MPVWGKSGQWSPEWTLTMVVYESSVPVYVQVANILKARIERGELLPDRPVPSEGQLQQEFGVARATARKSIALLREEGLIITVKGRGSYVKLV